MFGSTLEAQFASRLEISSTIRLSWLSTRLLNSPSF